MALDPLSLLSMSQRDLFVFQSFKSPVKLYKSHTTKNREIVGQQLCVFLSISSISLVYYEIL
jgi:hypothetical protein